MASVLPLFYFQAQPRAPGLLQRAAGSTFFGELRVVWLWTQDEWEHSQGGGPAP